MNTNFNLAKINTNYCNYLRKYESKVPYNKGEKELRPFIGVLLKINDILYFAPLTSPKKKHLTMKNTIDFVKINDGIYGAINFNNMIPVTENNYKIIDLTKKYCFKSNQKYKQLLINQLTWLNERKIQIRTKSYNLYTLYNSNKLSNNIKKRCCNFKLLEEKCLEYNKEKISV